MLVDFDPSGERAREYAALTADISRLIRCGVAEVQGEPETMMPDDGIRVYGSEDPIVPTVINGFNENYFVVFFAGEGSEESITQLSVNHDVSVAKTDPEDEEEIYYEGLLSLPIKEGVTYVFENIGGEIRVRKDAYLDPQEPTVHLAREGSRMFMERLISHFEFPSSLPVSLEELRFVNAIVRDPLDWDLLRTVSMPHQWELEEAPDFLRLL